MCGVCGIIDFKGAVVEEQLRKMMKKMHHRGPDDDGIFLKYNIGLGFVRLSIIDLSILGHQPMISNDERYILTFNGEIYNYIELREELKGDFNFTSNTDTEVLLAAFIKWKEKCLDKLNGMFVFLIYDQLEKKLFGARDRYGIKPFYYTFNEHRFIYASEIPPILEILNTNPSPDNQTIFDYLVFNRTDQAEQTFFENIKKLQHGNFFYLDINSEVGKISSIRWYDLEDKLINSFADKNDFKETFTSAVKLRLRSDVPVGVCLSGGIDSSSIVSIISQTLNHPEINTFSAVYGNNKKGDESNFIKQYEGLLNNMYFTFPSALTLFNDKENFVKAHGEPVPSTGPYAHFKVMELAKDHVVVTLDGQGADEELAGYHYFFGFYFKELLFKLRIIKLIQEIFFYSAKHKSMYGLKAWIYSLLPANTKLTLRITEKGYLDDTFNAAYKKNNKIVDTLYNANSLNKALINHFEFKLEHLLKWEDRNSMWFSLESRVPFLDYRIVEMTLSLPSELKINHGSTKYILRESMRGLVPEMIINRKDKVGFATPQDEWFREEFFVRYIKDILTSAEFSNRKIINPEIAYKMFNDHIKKKLNISNEIWKWINLHLWFQMFIERK
jgi:asparagine synthase (glutamine-hydrolysing)